MLLCCSFDRLLFKSISDGKKHPPLNGLRLARLSTTGKPTTHLEGESDQVEREAFEKIVRGGEKGEEGGMAQVIRRNH